MSSTKVKKSHYPNTKRIYKRLNRLEKKFCLLLEEIDDLSDEALEIKFEIEDIKLCLSKTKVHNPLTEEQTSSINPDIEILLTSEVDKYTKKKNLQRHTKSILDYSRSNLDQTEINLRSNLDQTEINLRPNLQIINSEDEINT
ncbi:hypothetical protein Glove_420g44 [Diversispora epigaea]|uniref:Uncharacterized protein n=1 Tax=Diversispora epigaea TaxID=1348612 RepID=A0A397GWU8_9GLOM|nr:hypothetical protein Glove_420g44 [Diversispora epigaea]